REPLVDTHLSGDEVGAGQPVKVVAVDDDLFLAARDGGVRFYRVRRWRARPAQGRAGEQQTRRESRDATHPVSVADLCYSGIVSSEPPKALGKSLNFGSPSFIGRTLAV